MTTASSEDAPRLTETADNPCPPGARGFWAQSPGGVRLRAAFWPASEGARGMVMLLQGRTEFIEKYFEVVGELRARGFAVLAFDWRGQGGSARLLPNPLKGHIEHYEDYLADLDTVLAEVAPQCPKPLIVLAHSTGANVALQALHDRPGLFARAILTAPLTGLHLSTPFLARLIAGLAPATAFVPGGRKFDPRTESFEGNPVTHDRARFLRTRGVLEACASLAIRGPTWGWLKATFAAMRRVTRRAFLKGVSVPVLLLSSSEDAIVDSRTHLRVAAGIKGCELVAVAGAKHEIMMETDDLRAQFWRALDGFV